MLGIVSYCNFVFKTRRFPDIRLQKCRDLKIGLGYVKVIENVTIR